MIDGLSDNGSWLFNKEKTLHFLGIGAWLFWQVVTGAWSYRQVVILSTWYFINLTFCQLGILSIRCFVSLSPLYEFSCCFVKVAFHEFAILPSPGEMVNF